MLNIEQKIDLLLARAIVNTHFATVAIPATASQRGKPIGQGKCKAVILYLNSLVLNTTGNEGTIKEQAQIYYGDNRSQFRELIRGQVSDIIFCKDLSEVYVRCNGIENVVQVTVYLGEDDTDELKFLSDE